MSLDTKCYGAFKWTQVRGEAGHGMPWHRGVENLFLNNHKNIHSTVGTYNKCLFIWLCVRIFVLYIHIYICIYIYLCQLHQFLEFTDSICEFENLDAVDRRPGAFHVAKAVLLAGSTVGVELCLQLKRVGIRWVKRVVLCRGVESLVL